MKEDADSKKRTILWQVAALACAVSLSYMASVRIFELSPTEQKSESYELMFWGLTGLLSFVSGLLFVALASFFTTPTRKNDKLWRELPLIQTSEADTLCVEQGIVQGLREKIKLPLERYVAVVGKSVYLRGFTKYGYFSSRRGVHRCVVCLLEKNGNLEALSLLKESTAEPAARALAVELGLPLHLSPKHTKVRITHTKGRPSVMCSPNGWLRVWASDTENEVVFR